MKVYWNAKLVFAGGKFNGYGVTLKDFTREVCVCVCVCVRVRVCVHVCVHVMSNNTSPVNPDTLSSYPTPWGVSVT